MMFFLILVLRLWFSGVDSAAVVRMETEAEVLVFCEESVCGSDVRSDAVVFYFIWVWCEVGDSIHVEVEFVS